MVFVTNAKSGIYVSKKSILMFNAAEYLLKSVIG